MITTVILVNIILQGVAMPSSRGIFLTQVSNPCLPYCRQILYHLSYQETCKSNLTRIKNRWSYTHMYAQDSTKKCYSKRLSEFGGGCGGGGFRLAH